MNYDPEHLWKVIDPVKTIQTDRLSPPSEPQPTFRLPRPIEAGETESARIFREAQERLEKAGKIKWFPIILKLLPIAVGVITMGSKTTWLTILQVAVSILGILLAGFGFDEATGKVAVSSPTWAYIAGVVYVALKMLKGFFTADTPKNDAPAT